MLRTPVMLQPHTSSLAAVMPNNNSQPTPTMAQPQRFQYQAAITKTAQTQ
jgi:hypothetical protein